MALPRLRSRSLHAKTHRKYLDRNCPKYGTIGVSGWCRAELEKVMSQRARFQQGMVYRVKRKQGPDCWIFRWREEGVDGKRVRRKMTLGTVKEYSTETSALTAAQVLRVTINAEQSQSFQAEHRAEPVGEQPDFHLTERATQIDENALMPQRRYPREKMIEQDYGNIRTEIVALLHAARTASARSVNALMTASFWEIGRSIVQFEQQGDKRAEYGDALASQLADDLTRQFGRGTVSPIFGRCALFIWRGPKNRFSRHCRENLQSHFLRKM